jgi:DNA-binding CsgD family transcriptional regulator
VKFPAEEFTPNFIDLFPSENMTLRAQMKLTLDELENVTNSFCAAAWIDSHEFSYLGKSIESILGYPYSLYQNKGVLFFYSLIPPEEVSNVNEQNRKHYQRLHDPGFNIRVEDPFETISFFRSCDGRLVRVNLQAMFIDRDKGDSFFMIAAWHAYKEEMREIDNALLRSRALLARIKSIYVEMHPERFGEKRQSISPKEKDVLDLLIQGLTTRQVGLHLGISFHTVESHRRNLLKKFSAKNTVELLSKIKDELA